MIARPHSIADGLPEDWAVEWGEDRFGVFVAFAVTGADAGEIVQRLRWIPPGRFLMGSPESEAGRYDDEVQHLVEISRGFWLGDTPVTQALWQAVMGNNPSRFGSRERPVEQVSWDECQQFIARLNRMVDGLDLRLPSEAEWEYACRGGTKGATWVGELDIRGENNAPRLDTIAWYGGNSGKDFDLPEGENSSAWPRKQYKHTRAGTRAVRGKQPNPYGLYDMLGNVYEWCEDWNGLYEHTSVRVPVIDPRGPRTGSHRVYRGGSWRSLARHVRAADRYASPPDSRHSNLGFRLARGQGPVSGAEPSGFVGRSPSRGAAP